MSQPGNPIDIALLRRALRQPLPGLGAQMRMAPRPRPGTERIFDPDLDCRRAAVLALLYPQDIGTYLVLTRRTEGLATHQGQISLPGGSMEDGEEATHTALREAREELGINPDHVEVLGLLTRLYVPPSNFCIQPVVAYTPERPAFAPADVEVAEVIEEPIEHLLDSSTCDEETWPLRGEDVRVPFYRIGPHKVWGATAMILCELLSIIGHQLTADERSGSLP
jgi:8-oxo-dGTP pyrophosphatase MutT (NUDIX family)